MPLNNSLLVFSIDQLLKCSLLGRVQLALASSLFELFASSRQSLRVLISPKVLQSYQYYNILIFNGVNL
jgi:hypothetical protein